MKVDRLSLASPVSVGAGSNCNRTRQVIHSGLWVFRVCRTCSPNYRQAECRLQALAVCTPKYRMYMNNPKRGIVDITFVSDVCVSCRFLHWLAIVCTQGLRV